MLILLSPAKKLKFSPPAFEFKPTKPRFEEETMELATFMKALSVADISSLMNISENLAILNYDRYKRFLAKPLENDVTPAAFTFAGDTYVGLDASSLPTNTINFLQNNVRIISGLYGLLRPLDNIQAYRLEMGSQIKTQHGKNLYAYWGTKLSKVLEAEIKKHENKVIVNLASEEYFKSVNTTALMSKVITPKFLENKNGDFKVISFLAKKA